MHASPGCLGPNAPRVQPHKARHYRCQIPSPAPGRWRLCPSLEVACDAVWATENRVKPTCRRFLGRMCRPLSPFRTAVPQACACLARRSARRSQSASSLENIRGCSRSSHAPSLSLPRSHQESKEGQRGTLFRPGLCSGQILLRYKRPIPTRFRRCPTVSSNLCWDPK
jgi:hypothetical protein